MTRNGAVISGYDYIDVEDCKSHEYKGVFVSAEHAEDVKRYLEEKIQKVSTVISSCPSH